MHKIFLISTLLLILPEISISGDQYYNDKLNYAFLKNYDKLNIVNANSVLSPDEMISKLLKLPEEEAVAYVVSLTKNSVDYNILMATVYSITKELVEKAQNRDISIFNGPIQFYILYSKVFLHCAQDYHNCNQNDDSKSTLDLISYCDSQIQNLWTGYKNIYNKPDQISAWKKIDHLSERLSQLYKNDPRNLASQCM